MYIALADVLLVGEPAVEVLDGVLDAEEAIALFGEGGELFAREPELVLRRFVARLREQQLQQHQSMLASGLR